ncbi:MAG: hypothetical protein ACXACT_17085 [Candidatus Thorarchaeota archaeon]|jgi:hypothetical protein
MDLGENICVGNGSRCAWNLYHQMLVGAKAATTKYVATAEDDVLYSREHYHTQLPDDGVFLYDMNRWSIYTWTTPPLFSYKANRLVGHQMLCERDLLIETLEERFEKWPSPATLTERHLRFFGEPGRGKVERGLGLTRRKAQTFWSSMPSVVFTHEDAIGYMGTRKALGVFRSDWLLGWGTAEDVMSYYA